MDVRKNFFAASVEGIYKLEADNLDDAMAEVKEGADYDGNVYIFHFRHEAEEKELGEGFVNEVPDQAEVLAEWREKHSDEIVATVRITRDLRMERRARQLQKFRLADWNESEE